MKILQVGAETFKPEEYINTDIDTLDITKPWQYEDNSLDAVIAIHVLQEIPWRGLVPALMEAYRVLKPGGTFRVGVPTIDTGRSLKLLLSWGNVNVFSKDLLERVFKQIGFKEVKQCNYRGTFSSLDLHLADNRPDETMYLEATK